MKSYIGKKIGKLYIYKTIENEAVCYCSNCRRSNVKLKEKDLKDLLSSGKNVTCGCKLEEALIEIDNIKLGTTFGRFTVVKRMEKSQYECRCVCGTLEVISSEKLKSGKKNMCDLCQKKEKEIEETNSILENNRIKKELYYIWILYKQLYKNPVDKFKKQIIEKNIKFFPELKDDFNKFCQWAIFSGYQKNGKVYLDRINKEENFSTTNCFWNSDKTGSFVKIPSRNINKDFNFDEYADKMTEKNLKLAIKGGNLCRDDIEIAKIENQISVKQDKERLIKYLKKHYNIKKMSFQINDLIIHLNSGIKANGMIVPIKIEYKELLQKFKNYENIFEDNHKEFKPNFYGDNNKMLFYDLETLINDLDVYDERLRQKELEKVRLELEEYQNFVNPYELDMEEY